MAKNKLLILPFAAGIGLLIFSWLRSYPLSIDSPTDYIFNHVSPFYWVGLSLTLASLFLVGLSSKRHVWKWAITVCLVTAMFSISYYYLMLPGSDSQSFRGLNEYYISVSKTPSEPSHSYYGWPLFFVLNNVATSFTGLQLFQFDFVLYAVIGFLFATALYLYFAKSWKKVAFVAVACFFLAVYYFLNYQAVPFSFAFSLFLLLVVLGDKLLGSREGGLASVFLFVAIALSHAFVAVFFVVYELVWYVLSRKRKHFRLFLLTLTIYLSVQLFQAPLSFVDIIKGLQSTSSKYYVIAQRTVLVSTTSPIDFFAQTASRAIVVISIVVCVAGFLPLVFKKGIRDFDKAVFMTGALYSAIGAVTFVLGQRAIPILFMPLGLGVCYLFETRFRHFLEAILLILLILFPLILVHLSFENSQIMFQTNESYVAENFMTKNYNWTFSSLVLAHFRVYTYLVAKENGQANFETDFSHSFPRINAYDAILYTVGLGINLEKYNLTTDRIFSDEMLNKVYDDGQSYLALKSYNFTWAPVFR